MKVFTLFVFLLFSGSVCAQAIRVNCSQKEQKNLDGIDPIIITTCFYKYFKLVRTSYPDHVGRYVYSEHKLFIHSKGKYRVIPNRRLFNQRQNELLALINQKIKQDFSELKADTSHLECLEDMDSIPFYSMNQLKISFQDDEMWFSVQWGLRSGCLAVDGTIVTFKLKEIQKYLN